MMASRQEGRSLVRISSRRTVQPTAHRETARIISRSDATHALLAPYWRATAAANVKPVAAPYTKPAVRIQPPTAGSLRNNGKSRAANTKPTGTMTRRW